MAIICINNSVGRYHRRRFWNGSGFTIDIYDA